MRKKTENQMERALVQELLELAARLDIEVRREVLGDAEMPASSGLVRIHGRPILYLDTRATDQEILEVFARELAAFPIEGLYLKPAVRRLLRLPES